MASSNARRMALDGKSVEDFLAALFSFFLLRGFPARTGSRYRSSIVRATMDINSVD